MCPILGMKSSDCKQSGVELVKKLVGTAKALEVSKQLEE